MAADSAALQPRYIGSRRTASEAFSPATDGAAGDEAGDQEEPERNASMGRLAHNASGVASSSSALRRELSALGSNHRDKRSRSDETRELVERALQQVRSNAQIMEARLDALSHSVEALAASVKESSAALGGALLKVAGADEAEMFMAAANLKAAHH